MGGEGIIGHEGVVKELLEALAALIRDILLVVSLIRALAGV